MFVAPVPDVTIFILPGNLYVGAPLTLTCDVDFDSSIASDVNVTVTWLRETSLLLNATDHIFIASSLSESQFMSNLTLDPLSTADATNFTCRAEIVLSDDFTSLTASNVGEETVWITVEGELLTDSRCHISICVCTSVKCIYASVLQAKLNFFQIKRSCGLLATAIIILGDQGIAYVNPTYMTFFIWKKINTFHGTPVHLRYYQLLVPCMVTNLT